MSKRQPPTQVQIIGFFDTETTTAKDNETGDKCAVPIAQIWKPRGEAVHILRYPHQLVEVILRAARRNREQQITSVIGVYNVRFDVMQLEHYFNEHSLEFVPFSRGAHTYAIDTYSKLTPDAPPVIRFWDMRHLVPEGLEKMGEIIGYPKLAGKWDYKKDRTPHEILSRKELAYCDADVTILEKFCEWLPKHFAWLKEDDLGLKCLTPASIARLYQQRIIAPIAIGKKTSGEEFHAQASRAKATAKDDWHALRLRAYAGGYTFVRHSSLFSQKRNVHHYDLDSAYHYALTMIASPSKFIAVKDEQARLALAAKIEQAGIQFRERAGAKHYELAQPFGGLQFHAHIRISGVAMRSYYKNGYLSARRLDAETLASISDSRRVAGLIHGKGVKTLDNRIVSAERLDLVVDEYELAALYLAYDFEAIRFLRIEIGTMPRKPSYFTRLSTFALRAEKTRRKLEGGGQYEFFKRIYNSQAGLYAETRDEGAFSYAHLPLAIRITSFTRLYLLASQYALAREGLTVLSGDTDSLKVIESLLAPKAEKILTKLSSTLDIVKPSEFEREISRGLLDTLSDADAAKIGRWELENIADYHKELGAKQRIFTRHNDGTIVVKYAGARTSKLADKLNEHARKYGAEAAMRKIKPNMWIAHELVPAVKVFTPKDTAPREVSIKNETYILPRSPLILDSIIKTPEAPRASAEYFLNEDLKVEKIS